MTIPLRFAIPTFSAAIFVAVNAMAAGMGNPGDARLVMLLSGLFAIGAAVKSAVSDRSILIWALLFSLPPVIALIASDSAVWTIGPLGALLFVASELNALGWELRRSDSLEIPTRGRLLHIAWLGAAGLVGSLAVGMVALLPGPGGTTAIVLSATGLVALALVTFARGG